MLVIFSFVSHSQTIRTVVLDAGHGGKDPGTVNGRNYEKTINLSVVRAAGAILERNPLINVIYTRSDDRFVELAERSSIAMRAKADLFVSVHTNASPNKNASGTETYIMGVDKSNANLGVAMRENGVISLESDYSTAYEGYDPNSTESLIMFSLMQYSFSRESLELAAMLQKQYKQGGRRDNGVRQAGFLVLWRNAMPSILTELGYLSNEAESKYLLSKSGQTELAKALAASVEAYVEQCDDADNQKVNSDNKSTQSTSSTQSTQSTQVAQSPKSTQSAQKPKASTATAPKEPQVKKVKPAAPPPPFVDDLDEIVIVGQNEKTDAQIQLDGPPAVFAVQVRSARDRVEINSSNFGPLVMQIVERKIENNYKYTVGALFLYKEALLLQDRIRKHISDAFIVAFDAAGHQISVGEARKMIDNN